MEWSGDIGVRNGEWDGEGDRKLEVGIGGERFGVWGWNQRKNK
jgi:hypothetical protein